MSFLKIANVSKSFASTQVLNDINIDIAEGEFVVLVGPSGCGKSTLLNTIAGLENVTAGQIEIAGQDVTHTVPADRDCNGFSVLRALSEYDGGKEHYICP